MISLCWTSYSNASLNLPITLEVDNDSVYLHELVRGSDMPNILIVDGLRLGQTVTITGAEFKGLLKKKLDLNLQVNGKGSVVLHRRSQVITTERINRIVTQYLQSKYSSELGRIVARIQLKTKILAPAGDVSIRVKEVESRDLKEKMFIWIEIQSLKGGSFLRKLLVKVENFQAYPFFKVDKEKNSAIKESDIVYRVVNVFGYSAGVPDLGLSKWRLLQSVSKHDPVTFDVIETVPDILKGQKLKVRLELNGIKIEYMANVKSDASINDFVVTTFNGKTRRVRLKKDLDGSVYGI